MNFTVKSFKHLTLKNETNYRNETQKINMFDFMNTSFNLILPSTDTCSEYKTSRLYCNFSSVLVFCGYLMQVFIFPLIILRMNQLKTRFRNQYSISILWLCSIALMTSIDFIEFILVGDPRVFSIFIAIFICVYFVSCLFSIGIYMKNYSNDGTHYQNALAILFSSCVFLIILFARIWSHKTLLKYSIKTKETTPFAFHVLNTYFFLYYFVYFLVGTVQVIVLF
jgi:hypothetical protein